VFTIHNYYIIEELSEIGKLPREQFYYVRKKVAALTGHKKNLGIISFFFLITLFSLTTISVYESRASISPAFIDVEGFRLTKFPLKILVDMNQWSTSEYAFAVHEAVDTWFMSIRTYSSSYNDTTLTIMDFTFFVSNINATTDYDIFITFTANEISHEVIGQTSYQWNPISHEILLPVIINLTTYSQTANYLFIKNVAMHEFGHALGLGHTSSQVTENGPELMYFTTYIDRVIYPSTLDLYGLIMVYKGNFKQSVQLPANIPYKIVQPAVDVPSNPMPFPTQSIPSDLFVSTINEIFMAIEQVWQTKGTTLIILIVYLCLFIIVKTIDKKIQPSDKTITY